MKKVRAGATLLFDSDPQDEELETELKALAMIDAIVVKGPEDKFGETTAMRRDQGPAKVGVGKRRLQVTKQECPPSHSEHSRFSYSQEVKTDVYGTCRR